MIIEERLKELDFNCVPQRIQRLWTAERLSQLTEIITEFVQERGLVRRKEVVQALANYWQSESREEDGFEGAANYRISQMHFSGFKRASFYDIIKKHYSLPGCVFSWKAPPSEYKAALFFM